MSEPKEIDVTMASGLRIRTMDIMLDGEALILDQDGEMVARYDARHREWRGSDDLHDAPQIVLSHDIVAAIVKAASLTSPGE